MPIIRITHRTRWPLGGLLTGCLCCLWLSTKLPADARDTRVPIDARSPSERVSGPVNLSTDDSVTQVATAIDRLIAVRWAEENLQPAPAAEDAEFLRRTYINIVGRIPTASEAQQFLDDKAAAKRRRLVDQLLESPAFARHYAHVLRTVLLPEANTDVDFQRQVDTFELWLRRRLLQNAGYDQIVRELLTVDSRSADSGFYYQAKAYQAENLAAGVSRALLGVRIECAQCHNHPFAKWRREQFWEFAAFFAGVRPNPRATDTEASELVIPQMGKPGSAKRVSARFLDGVAPTKPDNQAAGPRRRLAEWMTAPRNPYFARTITNRIWAHLLGTGLTDPVDDFDESNPPSHPELLDLLADEFVRHHDDIKFLFRAICASRTYQLSSAQTDARQNNRRLFARAPVKALTAAELTNILSQALGELSIPQDVGRAAIFQPGGPRSPVETLVREVFPNDGTDPVDGEATILQALALMNSSIIDWGTGTAQSGNLAALLDSPFLQTGGRIEMLYLATLSRRPTREELLRLTKYVDGGGAHTISKPKLDDVFQQSLHVDKVKIESDRNIALGDVFWALLNSSEFLTNH